MRLSDEMTQRFRGEDFDIILVVVLWWAGPARELDIYPHNNFAHQFTIYHPPTLYLLLSRAGDIKLPAFPLKNFFGLNQPK